MAVRHPSATGFHMKAEIACEKEGEECHQGKHEKQPAKIYANYIFKNVIVLRKIFQHLSCDSYHFSAIANNFIIFIFTYISEKKCCTNLHDYEH